MALRTLLSLARMPSPSLSSAARLHIVFVPGFGGFDALGQIEYYPGTAKVAEEWRAKGDVAKRGRVVLHYFDNLPTAGVRTRANRLKHYLTDRSKWNAFQSGDKIALVGHSTGGLDIRELLNEIERVLAAPSCPDDWDPESWQLEQDSARKLRAMISRVVFLSVPQRGTNIADWLRSVRLLRTATISALRNAVDLADGSLFEKPQSHAARAFHALRRELPSWLTQKIDEGMPDLLSAVADVLGEVAERGNADPVRAARARESLANLNLWLGQTSGDFLAIDDLCCEAPGGGLLGRALWRIATLVSASAKSNDRDVTSLARLPHEARARERAVWDAHHIEVLSFATRGRPPAEGFADSPHIKSYANLHKLLGIPGLGATDGPYRLVFHACASGPFAKVRAKVRSDEPDHQAGARRFDRDGEGASVPASEIASWHNDGIVNTASMLWPSGAATLLVDGDHADIIGHYQQLRPPKKNGPRKYRAYDIFGSNSGFDDALFTRVWERIFDHCLTALDAATPAAK
jgi:triacylglycerol lipase